VDAFREEQVEGETRTVLGFLPSVAPIKAAVLPLVNKDAMPETATALFNDLRKRFACFFDDGGAIGRRYRRMDEVGTPFCITVDGQTADDQTVTIRHRDSMAQDRVSIDQVAAYIAERLQ
jgi:glycyl-tRNA synthetase